MRLNNRGVISPLIFVYVAVAVIIVLFLVIGNLPIKDRLLGSLFPQMASQAAGVVDLELIPNAVSVAKDQTFLVDVAIDGKTEQPSGMNLAIKFDPQYVRLDSFQKGFYFDDEYLAGKVIDNSAGTAKTTYLQNPNSNLNPNGNPIIFRSGNGIAASLQFTALKATVPTSAIQIDSAGTQVAVLNKTGDQLGSTTDSIVTIADTPAVTKVANFSLSGSTSVTAGNEFNVNLRAQTPEEANLFAANLNFNPSLLEVVSISTAGSFITQWVNDNSFDNTTGVISLIGGVPAPGYKNTSPANMASVTFRAKSAGDAAITFGANSAIYRNSDNKDILITPVTGASITITGTAPSPAPSVTPFPSPSALPSTAPTANPSSTPSSIPSSAPSATPNSSTMASSIPSPSGSVGECVLTSANWVTSTNPVTEGKVIGLNVTGTGNCAGQSVAFTVLENDNVLGVGGTDPTRNSPPTAKFNSSNAATSNWVAEYQDDPSVVENNVPEYFFRAQLSSGVSITSANPELKVTALAAGTYLPGDFNKDGAADLADLSILLSNWNKTSDFLDALDLNQDGSVNSVDWGTMLQILRAGNVIN